MTDNLNPNWQKTLRELQLKYTIWIKTFNSPETGMEDVNIIMQTLYPGPYRVVDKYLPDIKIIDLQLEFDDPKEQTIWLLKWS